MAKPRPDLGAATATLPTMDRLPFRLHDFTRIMWVSDRARTVWQPRVTRIGQAWSQVERLTVVAGLRSCALQHASPAQLPALAADCARLGLSVLPLALEGQPGGPYATEAVPLRPDAPHTFRVAIGLTDALLPFKTAWDAGDQSETGRLLGYPACCGRFFQRVWVDERSVDTTWAMAGGTCAETAPRTIDVTGPPEANILLRWLGVRAVPHLPCSFACRDTVRLADGLLHVARESGFATEAEWIIEMLSWPVEWSALHGIAEVTTPVVKIATRTDASADKYVVRRKGQSYPAEGARGTTFPFQRAALQGPLPMSGPASVAPSARDALARPVVVGRRREHWYATDNGFASAAAMAAAHRPILELAAEHLGGRSAAVLDLGCGNGALLEALCAGNSTLVPLGVDADPRKIAHARGLQPGLADGFFVGDIFEAEAPWTHRQPDLVIVMPGRLLEVDADRAERLREWLHATGATLLVYAYDDWVTRYGDLEGLCMRAGLRISSRSRGGTALAAVLCSNA